MHRWRGGAPQPPKPAVGGCTAAAPPSASSHTTCPPALLQVRYLNRGAYGFVILAHDAATNEQVALKFIKRGPQVRAAARMGGWHAPLPRRALPRLTAPPALPPAAAAHHQVCG